MSSANANEITGKELFDYCKHQTGAENLMCAAYIAGFSDGVVMGQPLSLDMTQGQVCLPRNINSAELRNYFQRNATLDIINQPARMVLSAMLWEIFPCKANKQ